MNKDDVLQEIYDMEDILAQPWVSNELTRDSVMRVLTELAKKVASISQ